MAELKRSVTSYRRSGSSGTVWNNKSVSDEFIRDTNHQPNANHGGDDEHQKVVEPRNLRHSRSVGATADLVGRSQSTGETIYYRKVKVAPPSRDPPSPKLSTCGFFCFPVVTTQHVEFIYIKESHLPSELALLDLLDLFLPHIYRQFVALHQNYGSCRNGSSLQPKTVSEMFLLRFWTEGSSYFFNFDLSADQRFQVFEEEHICYL
ncbi:uncharacterized protein LOC114756786 [Neltuma alba]|uniref:uncharacterized protein LOC114756786 n=1 Tax=Neltuma alba TaxID=207710 RepID=UPI0010A3EB0F|nr:uncharacterized protein LOC114756786 [Prosopis alba]